MTDYVRQHYGLATTGKPTQELEKGEASKPRDSDPPKAPPPPKEKR